LAHGSGPRSRSSVCSGLAGRVLRWHGHHECVCMRVCMRVRACVHMHLRIYVPRCVHVHVAYMCAHTCICMCAYVYKRAHMHTRAHMCTHACTCTNACVHASVCICVHMCVFWSLPLLIKPAGFSHEGSTWGSYPILVIFQGPPSNHRWLD
jgi:hypothetical protein